MTIDGPVTANGVLLTSDRNTKENFAKLDSQSVLAKVATLPLTEWNYKNDSTGIRHVGPMAQDFHAAFGLDGNDDKHISVVDEGGVALAAIQGLNQKVEERNARIKALEQKNDSLTARLNELEATVKQLVARNDLFMKSITPETAVFRPAHTEINPKLRRISMLTRERIRS